MFSRNAATDGMRRSSSACAMAARSRKKIGPAGKMIGCPGALARLVQALPKRFRMMGAVSGRMAAEEADHRYRLLRARRERPSDSAAEERDELAPFHSITSSARC